MLALVPLLSPQGMRGVGTHICLDSPLRATHFDRSLDKVGIGEKIRPRDRGHRDIRIRGELRKCVELQLSPTLKRGSNERGDSG